MYELLVVAASHKDANEDGVVRRPVGPLDGAVGRRVDPPALDTGDNEAEALERDPHVLFSDRDRDRGGRGPLYQAHLCREVRVEALHHFRGIIGSRGEHNVVRFESLSAREDHGVSLSLWFNRRDPCVESDGLLPDKFHTSLRQRLHAVLEAHEVGHPRRA